MAFTGPEVRSYHEAVDWGAVAGAGHALAWCPASRSIGEVDARFAANWAAVPAAGLLRGAVHTLSTGYAGRGQARHFLDVIGDPKGSLVAVAVAPDGPRRDDPLPGIDQVAGFAAEFARLTGGHPLLVRTAWRWWARRDPAGAGAVISPWLWDSDATWVLRGDGRAWGTYGGWVTPIVWSTPRARCPGIAGLCATALVDIDAAVLAQLLDVDDDLDPSAEGLGLWRRARRWARARRRDRVV